MKRILPYLFIMSCVFCVSPNDLFADSIKIGTTFSKKQCEYLELNWKEAYSAITELDWDIIRLGAYWNEIETREGQFDFADLDWQIQHAKQKGIPIILTIGMKAPRWPEYFIPDWIYQKTELRYAASISRDPVLKKYTFRFISSVMAHYKNEPSIQYIQVENEALNKFGGKDWQLLKDFLKEEVDLVKSIDILKRPIILTAATQPNKFMRFLVNIFTRGSPIEDNLKICDILGINVYPIIGRTTLGIKHYVKNQKKHRAERFPYILKIAQKEGKQVWITELQAEPWEPGKLVHKKTHNPPSSSPEMTKEYFYELQDQGYKVFLFWGSEFWYHQKVKNGNEAWWFMAEEIIKSNKGQ